MKLPLWTSALRNWALAVICLAGCFVGDRAASGASSTRGDRVGAPTFRSVGISQSPAAKPDTGVSSADVVEIVRREFAGMVVVDTLQMHPHFMVGDFDGDLNSDLVVIGRLVSATSQRADGEPHLHVYVPMGTGMMPAPGDIRMSADLLAAWRGEGAQLVIHDFRRATPSPRRENALLLFSVNGESVLRLERGPLKPAIAGDEPEPIPPPVLKGDAILLLRDDGAGEALYWDGERYRWYPYGDWR